MTDLSHIWNAITPTTLLTTALVGLLFAVFLWHTFPRVTGVLVAVVWLGALAFIAAGGAGRYAEGSEAWQAYVGIGTLWTWYCAVAAAAVLAWRRVRRGRGHE